MEQNLFGVINAFTSAAQTLAPFQRIEVKRGLRGRYWEGGYSSFFFLFMASIGQLAIFFCVYLRRDAGDIIAHALDIADEGIMNKQEEELIQYIIHQTQIDRDTILRILNYRGVTELSEKYEQALKDAEELNVDSIIAIASVSSILRLNIDKKGSKSKLNKEALKESPKTVIKICRAFKEYYYRSLLD